jgi:hypothetical protein
VERVVQGALVGLGQLGRVDGCLRQLVQDRWVVVLGLALVLAESGQPLGRGAVLGRQLGEPALQRRTPWGINVVVAGRLVSLQLRDEVGLGPVELFQLTVQGRSLYRVSRAGRLGCGWSVGEIEVTARLEDPLAEEPADHVQQVVLAHRHRPRVFGVPPAGRGGGPDW